MTRKQVDRSQKEVVCLETRTVEENEITRTFLGYPLAIKICFSDIVTSPVQQAQEGRKRKKEENPNRTSATDKQGGTRAIESKLGISSFISSLKEGCNHGFCWGNPGKRESPEECQGPEDGNATRHEHFRLGTMI